MRCTNPTHPDTPAVAELQLLGSWHPFCQRCVDHAMRVCGERAFQAGGVTMLHVPPIRDLPTGARHNIGQGASHAQHATAGRPDTERTG